jgi:uncharacterized membrane protein
MLAKEVFMSDDLSRGVASKAAIASHPIHPMLVPFPIAFLVGTLATDLAFIGTRSDFWSRASMWLVGAGAVMGLLAAIFGFTDFVSISRARTGPTGWVHLFGNLTAVILAAASLWLRIGDPSAGVVSGGLILSIIITCILLVTGWLGGELAYRYKIGVIEEPETLRAAARESRRREDRAA